MLFFIKFESMIKIQLARGVPKYKKIDPVYFVEGSIVQHLALDIKIILSKNVLCKDFTTCFIFDSPHLLPDIFCVYSEGYLGREAKSQTKLKKVSYDNGG